MMIRSVSICVALCRRNASANETRRILQKALPVINQDVFPRQFQVTANVLAEDEKQKKSADTRRRKKGTENEKQKKPTVTEEMKMAAVGAAKSLPGDWTRTAEELLARLQTSQEPGVKASEALETTGEEEKTEQPDGQVSLLSTMKIGRTFDSTQRKGRDPVDRQGRSRNSLEMDRIDDKMSRRRVLSRRTENFTGLFKVKRLGIFDAEKLKKEGEQPASSTSEPEDLWAKVDRENMLKAKGAIPRNAFEEMVDWTREGKLWTFPIDNEADMHEERKYKFHDHIFLDDHLSVFPDKGPIRKFMELVVRGLSHNPHLTVPEKVEHISWFAQYFRDKQDILIGSIGEQGRMKDGEVGLEEK